MAKGNTDRKFYPLKGSIYYGHFFYVDPKYGKYSVTVGNLSEQNAKALASLGIVVKEDPKGVMGKCTKFNSKFPFKVFDDKGNEWNKDDWFGNGSKGTFTFYVEPSQKTTSGWIARCTRVDVTEYVRYVKPKNDDDLSDVVEDVTPPKSKAAPKTTPTPAVDFEDA